MRLTERERLTLHAYGQMGSLYETAVELGIHRQTLKNRLTRIYAKLGVPGGVAAVYRLLTEEERPT